MGAVETLLERWPLLVVLLAALYLVFSVAGFAVAVRKGRSFNLFKLWELGPESRSEHAGPGAVEALERRLREVSGDLKRRNQLLSYLGSGLSSVTDAMICRRPLVPVIQDVIQGVIAIIPQILSPKARDFGFYRAVLLVPHPDDPAHLVGGVHYTGFAHRDVARLRLPIDESSAGEAYEGAPGTRIYVPDTSDPAVRFWRDPEGSREYRTSFSVCLRDGEGGRVVLSADASPVDGLSRDDQDAIAVIAEFIECVMAVGRVVPEAAETTGGIR